MRIPNAIPFCVQNQSDQLGKRWQRSSVRAALARKPCCPGQEPPSGACQLSRVFWNEAESVSQVAGDVVGDDCQLVCPSHLAALGFEMRGLATARWAADADFEGAC